MKIFLSSHKVVCDEKYFFFSEKLFRVRNFFSEKIFVSETKKFAEKISKIHQKNHQKSSKNLPKNHQKIAEKSMLFYRKIDGFGTSKTGQKRVFFAF